MLRVAARLTRGSRRLRLRLRLRILNAKLRG